MPERCPTCRTTPGADGCLCDQLFAVDIDDHDEVRSVEHNPEACAVVDGDRNERRPAA
jgi:hypothetical protein